MAATRENVLAAIVQYVESNKRRAPAKDIAELLNDTLPNVQAIIKTLVTEGSINSSRGRNGGALPDGVVLEKKVKAAKPKVEATPATEVVAESNNENNEQFEQFAALMAKLEADGAADAAESAVI